MRLFRKRKDQDEKLLKNIEIYEQKKKTKQQESKVLGQKPIKGMQSVLSKLQEKYPENE